MEQLKVIGTEDGTIVLATERGERFALPIDDVLRVELRKARRDRDGDRPAPKVSPRDIQAHIRSGLSAAEVAELLGARLEDVRRYEGPVLAEREHVVGQALAVPVLVGSELEPDAQPTFGAAVRAKLAEVGAVGERWTSWREQSGWIVKLEFTANDVDHDARWTFDPRRSTLAPQNSDATQLSRQGSLPEGLIPRLRALDHPAGKDESRFDSGAFGPRRTIEIEPDSDAPDVRTPTAPAAQSAAIKRAPDLPVTSSETADLLEALRRRRGQREPLPGTAATPQTASPSPVAIFESSDAQTRPAAPQSTEHAAPSGQESRSEENGGRRRGGRPSMPSWDEIVFGARTEES
ncbi:septation protein SepH [Microbacterium sp. zg.Y625]|uniref:septation protein SepH n=1 Tax=Microbacterium jiangjiandongii TaxID=3049071 RepID=UPI00214C54A4|nr:MULTISPECIES: septation protein SepH [unclassified Microbacterium]MCR2792715.1 septation protein SepH [Microbacterium sp. zg.Y625]MCR2814597.1 septation protein SepH [Microbacterium sp. zg.Y843]WIM26694.1 septation protein SepH [Microbacterium sp. zg-Y625]